MRAFLDSNRIVGIARRCNPGSAAACSPQPTVGGSLSLRRRVLRCRELGSGIERFNLLDPFLEHALDEIERQHREASGSLGFVEPIAAVDAALPLMVAGELGCDFEVRPGDTHVRRARHPADRLHHVVAHKHLDYGVTVAHFCLGPGASEFVLVAGRIA